VHRSNRTRQNCHTTATLSLSVRQTHKEHWVPTWPPIQLCEIRRIGMLSLLSQPTQVTAGMQHKYFQYSVAIPPPSMSLGASPFTSHIKVNFCFFTMYVYSHTGTPENVLETAGQIHFILILRFKYDVTVQNNKNVFEQENLYPVKRF